MRTLGLSVAVLATVVLLAGCSSSHHAQRHSSRSTSAPLLARTLVAWGTTKSFRPGVLSPGQTVGCGGHGITLSAKVPPLGGIANRGAARVLAPPPGSGIKHTINIGIRVSPGGVVIVRCLRQPPRASLGSLGTLQGGIVTCGVCPPNAYSAGLVQVIHQGRVIRTLRVPAGARGRFLLHLPPGAYVLKARSHGMHCISYTRVQAGFLTRRANIVCPVKGAYRTGMSRHVAYNTGLGACKSIPPGILAPLRHPAAHALQVISLVYALRAAVRMVIPARFHSLYRVAFRGCLNAVWPRSVPRPRPSGTP